ncbi:amino acid adenylation domain-containing protein [Burkholderia pseudomallei]|uniref:amino acid adenylation domain-containing protein n=2 Tax=Burkholderia pseudomallei TaxID=28450 RepID=UPI0009B2489F|nr:amino acid adenylation domain-containing protein [Burkholderia pseudomallei]
MSDSNTVLERVRAWCAATPRAVAVATADATMTYGELDRASDAVAAFLEAERIGAGSIVPIEAMRTDDFVAGMLGIVKAGAAYCPIDHAYPEARKTHIVERTGSPLLLTAVSPRTPLACARAPRTASIAALRRAGMPRSASPRTPRPNDAIYVIFTSGTTGVPKGVVVEHRSVDGLIAWHNAQFGVDRTSRSTQIAALGFDAAHWEIWSPLCAGARLRFVDDDARRDANALVALLERERITHAFVPTVMARDVVAASEPGPSALRYLFTGGEKLNPVDTDRIRYRLIDYYGPTEATMWASFHPVQSASLGLPPSIGTPVGGARIAIFDERLREAQSGAVGEIVISGPCLARGYLDDPRQTAEKFLAHPSRPGERVYRTGDLGRRLPDGAIQFVGRLDDQVKIRGYLVEPGEVEIAIARQSGVRRVAVVATSPADGAPRELVAFVVPADPAAPRRPLVGRLRAGVAASLPPFMVPGHFAIVDALPLSANGKTDKAALVAMHGRRAARADFAEVADAVERTVCESFADALGHADFGVDDSFFDVGGHSLVAAAAVASLSARVGVALRLSDLYRRPSAAALAVDIRRRPSAGDPGALDLTPADVLRRDAILPDDIAFDGAFDPQRLARPAHVLLTGATGFVGVHLLAQLLATTEAVIHCVVRARDAHDAERRVADKLRTYRLGVSERDRARIRCHAGDIAHDRLGMASADYDALSRCVDVVHQSASAVNFIKPYAAMKRDNVDGLVNVIRFAAAARVKALSLLSTISVYSWGHRITGKTVMREDDDLDQNLDAVCADIGYVKSKWVMEKLADAARARGLPLITFRVGYATYHAQTGLSADYQWWGRLVKTCIALRAVPELRELREGLSTVDYMTAAIAHIARNPAAPGKKFNLTHSGERNLSLEDFFDRLERAFGFSFARVPFRDWFDRWKDDAATPLYPVLNLFRDPMHGGMCMVELYQHTYRWEHANTSAFLAGSGVRPPEFDEPELRRYLVQSIGIAPACAAR